jgi:hypothetical protein
MSTAIESQAEVIKIARALGLAPEELSYLADVDSTDLARLRDQITEAVFASSADRFRLLAGASRLLPISVAAAIAQRALGPLLAAQMAGLVAPARAVELARQLEPEFLADVATYLDPRRAAAAISKIPADLVGEVATVLVGRGDYVTMGRFVSSLEPGVISATFSRIPDAAMLQTAFVMEGKERLDAIVGLLPEARIPQLMAAARKDGLWAEILSLIGYLAPDTQSRLADLAAADDASLAGLTEAAERLGAWDAVLPIISRMNPANRGRVADLLRTLPDEVVDHLADAVERDHLWADLLQVAAQLEQRELQVIGDRLIPMAARLDAATAAEVLARADRLGLTARLGPIRAALQTAADRS